MADPLNSTSLFFSMTPIGLWRHNWRCSAKMGVRTSADISIPLDFVPGTFSTGVEQTHRFPPLLGVKPAVSIRRFQLLVFPAFHAVEAHRADFADADHVFVLADLQFGEFRVGVRSPKTEPTTADMNGDMPGKRKGLSLASSVSIRRENNREWHCRPAPAMSARRDHVR